MKMAANNNHDTPAGITVVDESFDSLTIVRRWLSPRHVIACVGAVILLWLAYCASQGVPRYFGPFVEQTLQPLAMATGALVLAYYGVVGIFNSTTIRLQSNSLEIHDGPLPAPGLRRERMHAVKTIEYDEEAFSTGRSGGCYNIIGAQLADGTNVVLYRIRGGEEQAKWIYLRIKRHLDNRRTPPEHPRSTPGTTRGRPLPRERAFAVS